MTPAPNRVLEVVPDAEAVARRAAEVVAAAAREAIAARGRFTFALSGGRTPWTMFRYLAGEDVVWAEVGIWQVDERVAPDGDPERNATGLREHLLARVPIAEDHLHLFDVTALDRHRGSVPPSGGQGG